MTIADIIKRLAHGSRTEFVEHYEELVKRVSKLEEEVEEIKYRYEPRKDLDEES